MPASSDSYLLRREQWIPGQTEEVLGFFSEASNLERVTPSWLRFQILTPPPVRMGAGSLIEYRLRWHGFPLRWVTEIELWSPPYEFVDVQLSGPYRLWRHTHRFVPESGGTRMIDIVQYVLPLGFIGRWLHHLRIRGDLDKIFDYRAGQIASIFSGG